MSGSSERTWYKLNNAAKIFPATSSKSDPKVFRFSCELTESVDGVLLQSALEQAIEDFPGFRYILKRGLFWYYMEQSALKPLAYEECLPPCSTIYLDRKSLLFDVTWYGKRINLEVYHALTDGTGALQFLKTLTLYYLKLAYPQTMRDVTDVGYGASESQKLADGYGKFYDRRLRGDAPKNPAAYQIKGAKEAEGRLKIIEGTVSTRALLDKTHELGASATVFVTALLIRAIRAEMSVGDRTKPIVITVPVNLRSYFHTKSALNFFSTVEIRVDCPKEDDSLADEIAIIKERFAEQLNKEYLQKRLNRLFDLERNPFIRAVPLPIKNVVMGAFYSKASHEITASVSNLGKITMPDEAKPYVRLFDVFASTRKLQMCMCSYEDKLNVSFTSPFISTDIQCGFFRQLARIGIDVEINANKLRI